jgi:hypothetical protein
VHDSKDYNNLQNGLGKKHLIDLQGVSEPPPNPSLEERGEKTGLVNAHSDVFAFQAASRTVWNFPCRNTGTL